MKAPGVSGESPSSRELVRRAIAGKPVPRVPTGPLAVHFCAGLAGHSLRRYSTEAGALAESVVRYYERFRPDAVWVSADTWVSAEAMGAAVGSDLENQPLGGLGPATVRTAAEVDRLPRPDPAVQGRYPRMVDAVRRVRRALGDGVYVVACFDQYPFSLAAALMGVDEIMLRLFDDPPMVRALMARCAEYSVAYGAALAEAGADLLSGGDSPAGLLGPELYAEFALPFEREVVTNLQRRTGLPVSLHICGDARPMLAGMGGDRGGRLGTGSRGGSAGGVRGGRAGGGAVGESRSREGPGSGNSGGGFDGRPAGDRSGARGGAWTVRAEFRVHPGRRDAGGELGSAPAGCGRRERRRRTPVRRYEGAAVRGEPAVRRRSNKASTG
jgi:uroporphyrinogen decarboxylase